MLEKSASVVLTSKASSTYPEGTPPVLSSAAGLLGTRRVSARQGGAGEKSGLFEHPARGEEYGEERAFVIKRILLATDFSRWARRAEDYACALACSWRASLAVLCVAEFPPGLNPDYPVNQQYLADLLKNASSQLDDLKGRAELRGIAVTTRMAAGIPSEEVIAAARAEDSDLVVVGTRGKTGLAHVLLGSTAERVIRGAPCPVLAVRTESADRKSVV